MELRPSVSMSLPSLLWFNLCVAEQPDPPAVFHSYFRILRGDIAAFSEAGPRTPAPRAEVPDVFCFEFDYPDMQGLRLIPEAKRRHPSVPILLLTTQHSADLALWALRARVFDYLVKPLAEDDVARCMEQLGQALEARRQQLTRTVAAAASRIPKEARYRPVRTERPLLPALSHVSRNLGSPIALGAVASLCGMSAQRFSREFKAAFGATFQEYLRDCRLAEARRLLANPAVPIADVAAMTGFTDASYFARLFRRYQGHTPSDFRQLAMEGRRSGVDSAELVLATG